MGEPQWPVLFVTMYQRVLRIKEAMEEEEALVSPTPMQGRGRDRRDGRGQAPSLRSRLSPCGDRLPTPEVYNEETYMHFSWDYLEQWGDWKKWHDWEDWDSWNK